MSEAQEQAGATKKAPTTYTTVTMEDGRVVDFPGKRKLLKESGQLADGSLGVRIDFINGKSIKFQLPAQLINQFALHGAEQKLGDAAAGSEDIDDAFEAVSELALRLGRGEWTAERKAGNGLSGASTLVKALCQVYPNKTPEQIREFLSKKTHAEKLALRNSEKVLPVVQALEAAKTKKATVVDTDAMLADLE